jgi:Kef-type K+ transport system membrane component KefB
MPLFTTLLLLLIVARVAGEATERLGQPAMIGEILAGVLLGPSVLNLLHISPELQGIADLGVFLLVLLAGMAPRWARSIDWEPPGCCSWDCASPSRPSQSASAS